MKLQVLVLAAFWANITLGAESTINVDFQPGPNGSKYSADYHGQGGLPDPDHDTWNVVTPPVDGYDSAWGSGGNYSFKEAFVSSPLFDSSGLETPVTVSIQRGNPLGTTFSVNPSNTWAYEHIATDARNLMSDYLIAPGNSTNSVLISHLISGAIYTICLYGAGDQAVHQTAFIVNSNTLTTRGVPDVTHTITEGADYVVFRDVQAVDGTITVYFTGAGSSHDGNFNGFQIRGEWPAKSISTAPSTAETNL